MTRDPNKRPFQRGSFVQHFRNVPGVHVRRRGAYEDYFRQRDPRGFRHDLGAQDVFLDNAGIVFREQLEREVDSKRYLAEVDRFLHGPWQSTRHAIVPRPPWWGKNVNADSRRAATGEPRPRLRLIADAGRGEAIGAPEQANWSWPGSIDGLFEAVQGDGLPLIVDEHETKPYGLVLPEHLATPVRELALLPVRYCTPDLPARVGVDERDQASYEEVLDGRDQSRLAACASFATVFALELAAKRAGLRGFPPLSPGWLHLATGAIDTGRRLSDLVDCVTRRGLPCGERALPYEKLLRGTLTRFEQRTSEIDEDQVAISGRFPRPEIISVPHDDIARVKVLLAAGWILVVATRVTESLQNNPVAMTYGVPLLPLPGSRPAGAHAWCLVGYDHVDGALTWKYQGRFVALNSWGKGSHRLSPHGGGTLSLPFAFVFQEGFAAFAFRFRKP